jgi:uncharacterized protein YciI
MLCLLAIGSAGIQAQLDTAGFETFIYAQEDTSFVMKKYYLCLYKKGPDRSQSKEEAQEIQKGHLANIRAMAEAKVVCIAGPFQDSEKFSGVLVFSVKDKEEAIKWLKKDPAVQAGRLDYELHAWWAAMGSSLF